jgi:hypothetical protein
MKTPLRLIAAAVVQQRQRVERLDTLGDHLQFDVVGQVDRRAYGHGIVAVGGRLQYGRPVDPALFHGVAIDWGSPCHQCDAHLMHRPPTPLR